MRIVLFVEDEAISHVMTLVGLDEDGTKSFGTYVQATVNQEGDIKKMIFSSDKSSVTAAYCNGKVAFKKGIRYLSDGKDFISVKDFKNYCEEIILKR